MAVLAQHALDFVEVEDELDSDHGPDEPGEADDAEVAEEELESVLMGSKEC